jgi:hypothetical protein
VTFSIRSAARRSPSSRTAFVVAGTSQTSVRRRPGRDGCGIRVHTTPDALATSTAATRSSTCSCSSSSISSGSLITAPFHAIPAGEGLPRGLGQEAENLTSVLVATVRDPKVKAPRQTK